jgi:hypothetical protein
MIVMKTETIQAKANTPNPTKSLEARIAEALDPTQTPTAVSLEPLLDESGATINSAYDTAERERLLSLELSCCDPASARKHSQDAAFTAERLGGIHEKLLLRYRSLKAAEARAEHDALVARRSAFVDSANRALEARYAILCKELIALAENGNGFPHVREFLRLPSLYKRNVLAFPRPAITALTNIYDPPARLEPEPTTTEAAQPPAPAAQRGDGPDWWHSEQVARSARQAEEAENNKRIYLANQKVAQERDFAEREAKNSAVLDHHRREGWPA